MATEPQELKTLHAREYTPWGAHAARELDQRDQQPHLECYGLSGASAGLLNHHIAVLVGGRELPFESFSNTSRLDLFDLSTHKWLTSYDIDGSFASRVGHSVVTVRDRVFAFGGERVASEAVEIPVGASCDWNSAFFNDVHELSFSNNVLCCKELSFATAPQDTAGGDGGAAPSTILPSERAWHASARVQFSSSSTTSAPGDDWRSEDAVLVLGGKDANGRFLSDVWLLVLEKATLDPQTGTGIDPEATEHSPKSPSLEPYTPRWIQLSPTGSSPLPLAYHSAVALNDDGSQIAVLGGKQSSGAGAMLDGVFILDLATNTWSTLSLSPSPAENPKASLTARCCFTALSMVLPMEEPPNGKIAQFLDEIPLEAIDAKRQQLGHDVIFIYGGFSELSPSLSTTSCVLLDVANSSIRELATPNVGLTSYTGHACVSTCDRQSMYLFGGIDPRTNQFTDATSAVHFWRPQPFIDGLGDDGDANANPIKTRQYDNGDVYVGEMVLALSSQQQQQGAMHRHGQGKCTYANGDEYDGAWDDDQRCGQGTMTYANGDVYAGEWQGDQRHGYGILQRHVESPSRIKQRIEVKHDGQWRDGDKCGSGTTTYSNGSTLDATWESDGSVRHGRIAHLDDGNGMCSYEGQLSHDGLPEGEGSSEHAATRETYSGQWHLGRRSGHGVATLLDGTTYTGDWRNGKRNGFGSCEYARTRDVYSGKWVGGVRCGRGVCTYANGSAYDGEWRDDKCHGHGRFTFAAGSSGGGGGSTRDGSAFYEGSWKENKFCGDGALVLNVDSNSAAAEPDEQ